MKKQKLDKKLALARETIQSLQTDLLGDVGGGNARTLTWTCDPTQTHGNTKFLCMPPPVQ